MRHSTHMNKKKKHPIHWCVSPDDSCISAKWLIYKSDSYLWHDSFIWLIHMCDLIYMTHSYVWLVYDARLEICICDTSAISTATYQSPRTNRSLIVHLTIWRLVRGGWYGGWYVMIDLYMWYDDWFVYVRTGVNQSYMCVCMCMCVCVCMWYTMTIVYVIWLIQMCDMPRHMSDVRIHTQTHAVRAHARGS